MSTLSGSTLLDLITRRAEIGLQPTVDFLNQQTMPAALTRYNSEFSPRYFGRPPSEEVPTEPRLLTTFRTRLGTLIEYGVAVVVDEMLADDHGEELRMSFAVAHEYPDYFIRDVSGAVLLKLDAKALHDESDEYSARFRLKVSEIDSTSDLLLYLAWQWRTIRSGERAVVYPHVLEGIVVPAIDVALERDRNLEARGGWLDEDEDPRVPPSGNVDTNYGKINRIVHESRRQAADLSPNLIAFLEFTARHADAVARASSEVTTPQPTADELEPPAEGTVP